MFDRAVMCLVAASLCCLSGMAVAQATPAKAGAEPEPPGYKAVVASAVEEYEQKNFAEARAQFERAHALFPNARTLRGLGITAFELRNYGESVSLLEQALASPVKRLEGPLRQETEGLLARARAYIGKVDLDLEPASASVTVDGITVELTAQRALILDVGDHVLEFRSEGRLAERRAIRVKGGEVQRLQVVLRELAPQLAEPQPVPAAPAPDAAAASRSERVPLRKRWWLWTVVGVVVTGAAVGTALALNADPRVEEQPVTTANTPEGVAFQPLWAR